VDIIAEVISPTVAANIPSTAHATRTPDTAAIMSTGR
jgi:hypothetical protein